jgi:hypothetical protein
VSDVQNPPPAAPPADPPKAFSQADVDRIVGERLARAKAEPPPDYDELKKAKARLDEIEAANKTELEKAAERAAQAEAKATAAEDRARKALLRSAVTSAAVTAGAVDPDAVLALLDKTSLTVADDGTVSGLDDAVKALLEAKPYLVGKAVTPPPGGGDGGPRGKAVDGVPDFDQMNAAQINEWFSKNPTSVRS